MKIFTVQELELLRLAAVRLLLDLDERTSKFQYTKDQKIGVICGHLQEVFSTGYFIALSEVRSTPWEYLTTLAATGPQANSESERAMNALSGAGWDLYMTTVDRLIWRRRKAVGNGEG